MFDMYAGSDDAFTIGMAGPFEVGVFSFARYDPCFLNPGIKRTKETAILMLKRCCKVAAHEIAHNFGIEHCSYYQCLMNGSGHLEEDFSQPMMLCPVDLRKVTHFTGTDVVMRYRKLLDFFTKEDMQEEVDWITKRLQFIEGDSSKSEDSEDNTRHRLKRKRANKKEEKVKCRKISK